MFLCLMFNCIMQFYEINFGHSQILFMGSVPRINRLLTTVSRTNKSPLIILGLVIKLACRCVSSKLSSLG